MPDKIEIAPLVIYVAIAITLMVPFIILLGFKLRNRHIRHIKEKQQLEYNYKQEILHTQIEIQQQTLQTISQEIHDNISQLLSIVKIHLNTMQDSAEQTLHHQQIVKTNELVSRIILDLRNLSKGINPDFVQRHGLPECVRFELERLQNTGLYTTGLAIQGTPYNLELSKEFVIYRVIQENINNIIRHAKAKEIRVELHYWPNNFRCSIFDNGQGFVVEDALQADASSGGSGLHNMQRRMEMIDGKINIKSILNLGTQVDLILLGNY
jgi:two-component system, NarL family, sensor kinase